MAQPVLVAIDDEMEFTKTIEQFFSVRGYTVHVALTGSSGLELVESHKPQVVLVDLKLPGMDGDELLQRIRRDHPVGIGQQRHQSLVDTRRTRRRMQ